jgi:hypothetical protein
MKEPESWNENPPIEVQSPSETYSLQSDARVEIKNIFSQNQVGDLKRFIATRARLNKFTKLLMYGSYVFQTVGIFVTTVSTGYKVPSLTWVGVGLNMISTLMIVFEKINTSVSVKIMKDIESIRNGTYVDEGVIIDDTKKDDAKA